jgi:hypothetical protein
LHSTGAAEISAPFASYDQEALPAGEQKELNPADIYECLQKHAPSNMEGVFIYGQVFKKSQTENKR